ncbi:MAG: DUF4164 family protein [Hyphomicrobiaceae bacterium]
MKQAKSKTSPPRAKRAPAKTKVKTKKTTKKTARAPKRPTVEELLLERAHLQQELSAAKSRITDLKNTNQNVADRLDWVIDSLRIAIAQDVSR